MSDPGAGGNLRLRRGVYALLIALSVGSMLGRILAVDAVDQQALEQSRIQKVLGGHASLPDYLDWKRRDLERKGAGGEQLAAELARARQIKADQLAAARLTRPFLSANDRSRWCTVRSLVEPEMRVPGAPYAIDRVIAQPGWDTIDMVKHDGHLYSSKPPLFPTLLAGGYWAIHRLAGLSLAEDPHAVGRIMLVAVNVLPLVLYFWLLAVLAERFGTTDWGRIFVIAAAAFGTFLTTFAVVINNHLPAAVCAAGLIFLSVAIWFDGQRRLGCFALAGFLGAFCVANELPAAALVAAVSLALLWKAPKETLAAYVPAALVVAAGFFATNWIAHQSLRPPYMHRSQADPADDWYTYQYEHKGRVVESYWQNRVGIDRGEPSPAVYALHALAGHHGVFSLTPVWLMSVAGVGVWLFRPGDAKLRELAMLIAAVSVVCVAFYLARPQDDRNYGGMTSGLRWVFWLAPLWLVGMLPAADALAGRRWTRALALVLLAVSVLSASYPTWNPWTHPWLLNFLHYLGWVRV